MEQTVYIDLFFLINTCMDLLCFFISCRLLSTRFQTLRCLIASAIGGIYACASLFFPFGGVLKLLCDLLSCALISAVAIFKKRQLKNLICFSLVYAAVSILLGGFMTVLFSFFNRLELSSLFGQESSQDGMSVWLFALLAAISAVISLFGCKFFKRRSTRRECRLEIFFCGKRTQLSGLCDSGNLLREPISGKACIIIDQKSASDIFAPDLISFLSGEASPAIIGRLSLRIRPIPTKSIHGEQLLYGIQADRAVIHTEKSQCDTDAFLVLGDIGASADGAQALVPSELMQGVP